MFVDMPHAHGYICIQNEKLISYGSKIVDALLLLSEYAVDWTLKQKSSGFLFCNGGVLRTICRNNSNAI